MLSQFLEIKSVSDWPTEQKVFANGRIVIVFFFIEYFDQGAQLGISKFFPEGGARFQNSGGYLWLVFRNNRTAQP